MIDQIWMHIARNWVKLKLKHQFHGVLHKCICKSKSPRDCSLSVIQNMEMVFVFMSAVHHDISQMTVSCVLLVEVTVLSISSDLHRNFFWSLDKPLALVIGKFHPFPIFFGSFDWYQYQIGWVRGNVCEGMNARLDSALWSPTLRLGEWEEVCPEYYRYYDGDMSQDGCDQSEPASVSAWLGFLVMGSNTTGSMDN